MPEFARKPAESYRSFDTISGTSPSASDLANERHYSKIVASLSRVESARFSVRLLARNFFTAFCTVTSSAARGGGSPARIEADCSSAASSSCLRLSSAFSHLRVRAVCRTGDPFRMPRIHLGHPQHFQNDRTSWDNQMCGGCK